MNILVFDVGTSSMRGVLFTHEGKELAEKQVLYTATYLQNGWVEQSVSDWENALVNITKHIVSQAKKHDWAIDAITMTSQRSSMFPVDSSIRPLTKAIMWQDKRTNEICHSLEEQNDQIFSLSGALVNPVFSGCKMRWVREEMPEVYDRTKKFLVTPDYLNYLMTGELLTDYTYGSRTQLMNLQTHEWDDQLLDLFQVEKDKLCDLIEPGGLIGRTSEDFAEITGCPSGIPVLSSGGDQQCSAIGQGVVKPGVLSVTVGTGGFLITAADHVPENLEQDVICNYSSVKGQYILESSVLTCCSAFDWFRKEFYEGTSFEELNCLIEEEPVGSNGCLCIPYFQGRSTPDWNNNARGVFANVTLATTRQDMLCSLLESICYEIRNGIDTMGKYVGIREINVNGGLTNSEAFNEMQANIYGQKITRLGKSDTSARGALVVTSTALGEYKSAEEAYQTIRGNEEVQVYHPQRETTLQYETYREKMNRLYQKMAEGQPSEEGQEL